MEERGTTEPPSQSVPDTPGETDIEDLFKTTPQGSREKQYCGSQFKCNDKSRENCEKLMKVYQNQTISHLKEFTENMRSMRHTVFLILMLCSMFVVSEKSMIISSTINTQTRNRFFAVGFVVHLDTYHGRHVWHLHRALFSGSILELRSNYTCVVVFPR